jgi:hypothetical protein
MEKNHMEEDIKQLIFIEDIKQRYKLEVKYTNLLDRFIMKFNDIDDLKIGINCNIYYIFFYYLNILLNFEEYEDMIEIMDMIIGHEVKLFMNIDIKAIKDIENDRNDNIDNIFIIENQNNVIIMNKKKIIKYKKYNMGIISAVLKEKEYIEGE